MGPDGCLGVQPPQEGNRTAGEAAAGPFSRKGKAGEVITGSVLKIREELERRPDSFKYVETEEIIDAISSDVITEVELVKGMCLSKRTIDEILSIYM